MKPAAPKLLVYHNYPNFVKTFLCSKDTAPPNNMVDYTS